MCNLLLEKWQPLKRCTWKVLCIGVKCITVRSEIRPFKIWKHFKSGPFEGWISHGPIFKWLGFSYGNSCNGCNRTGPLAYLNFCSDFKWFLSKPWPFVLISNGWAFGHQIPFEIWAICNPCSFRPFETKTSSDFRSHLVFILSWVIVFLIFFQKYYWLSTSLFLLRFELQHGSTCPCTKLKFFEIKKSQFCLDAFQNVF